MDEHLILFHILVLKNNEVWGFYHNYAILNFVSIVLITFPTLKIRQIIESSSHLRNLGRYFLSHFLNVT